MTIICAKLEKLDISQKLINFAPDLYLYILGQFKHEFILNKIRKRPYGGRNERTDYSNALRMSASHTYGGVSVFIKIQSNMTHGMNQAGTLLPMTVTEGVTVNVLPNEAHEYLMTSREVAHGYGTSNYVVRTTMMRHGDELIAGKHYVKGCDILLHPSKVQPHQVFWTKRGIVRLGFFIKSERARLFRDWAEELIISLEGQRQQPMPRQLPARRNHNRLTQERMISILADVCRIDDRELRLSITNKLMQEGGQA